MTLFSWKHWDFNGCKISCIMLPKNMHESYWYFSCSSFTSLQLDHSELVMFLQVLVYYIYATNMNITLVSIFHGPSVILNLLCPYKYWVVMVWYFSLEIWALVTSHFFFYVEGNWRWILSSFSKPVPQVIWAATSMSPRLANLYQKYYFLLRCAFM